MAAKYFHSAGERILAVVLLLGLGVSVSSSVPATNSLSPLRSFSFRACSDLVIGVPDENLEGDPDKLNAGAFNLIYGVRGIGLDYFGNMFWNLDTSGVGEVDEDAVAQDLFGNALTTGDYNADGYDDLVVGIHWRDVGGASNAGAVHVFPGHYGGVTNLEDRMWSQYSLSSGASETDDHFGAALASGDFDGDGFDDLAIGIPGEDIGSPVISNAGAVHIMYGSSNGLDDPRNIIWTQDSDDILGTAGENDAFGSALAAGDFDGDGYDDLAIGVPLDSVHEVDYAGSVNIIYGSSSGLQSDGNQKWHQWSSLDSSLQVDGIEENDMFGWSLAAGDFDHKGFGCYACDDLAVGVPYEDVNDPSEIKDVGAVHVLIGTEEHGIWLNSNELYWQSTLGTNNEEDDHFGSSLAAGDFDGDGRKDLVIGSPDEDLSAVINAGVAYVLYGDLSGVTTEDLDTLRQDLIGGESHAEEGDKFGYALAAGSFNCDQFDDLAISAPYDHDVSEVEDAGVVNVLYGKYNGLTATGNQIFSQDSASGSYYIYDESEVGDHFGLSLAASRARIYTYLPVVKK